MTTKMLPANKKAAPSGEKAERIKKMPALKKEAKKELDTTYNEFKQFEGRQYTGMQIGRSHNWEYDQGKLERNQDNAGSLADILCGH